MPDPFRPFRPFRLGLAVSGDGPPPVVITGTAPVLAPLTEGDALSDAVTWGSYSSTAGDIVDPTTREMRIGTGEWEAYDGATVAEADETYRVRETVTDTAANARTFTSGAEVAEAASGAVSHGDVEFPFEGIALAVGNSFDGSAYIVVPDEGSIDMLDPTPAVGTVTVSDGTFAANGVAINPRRWENTEGTLLPFDQRAAYLADNLATFPATLEPGDIVVKVISHPTVTQANRRRGVIQQYAVCHVVSQTDYEAMVADGGVSTWLSPAPFGWSGRSSSVWRKVDFAGLQSRRPELSLSGVTLPTDTEDNLSRLSRLNLGLIATVSTTEGGYESHSLNAYAGSNLSNYGQSTVEAYRIADLMYLGDADWSDIEEQLRYRVALGSWLFDIMTGAGAGLPADGGHWQFHLSNMLYGLLATGREASIATLDTVSPGNQLVQPFIFDSGRLAQLAPHDGSTDPYAYRRRNVTAVSGSSITVQFGLSGEPTWKRFYGLEVRRASDDSLVAFVSDTSETASTTTATIGLDRDVSGDLTTSDQVYFAAPAGWFTEGSPGWCIVANFARYTPSPTAAYYALNYWAGEALLVRGLDVYDDIFAPLETLMKRHIYNNSLPSDMIGAGGSLALPNPWSTSSGITSRTSYGAAVQDFWDAHAVTLGLGDAGGTVTLAEQDYPADFVAPYLGSTGREYGIVPLEGTGTVGATIQARAYDDENAGAGTTAWENIATVDGDGNWSADWQCPLTLFWALPEVRVAGDDETIQRGDTRFAVGLVAAFDGQSEIATGLSNTYVPLSGRPTVTAPGNCFMAHVGFTAGAVVTEDDYEDDFTHGLAARIANYIEARKPGLKSRIAYFAISGTGPRALMNDADETRSWSNQLAIWNAVTYSGLIKPSVLAFHWLVSTEGLGSQSGNFFSEILTQKRANGDSFSLPTTAESDDTPLDHTYVELFGDWSDTRVLNGSISSPHSYYANHQQQRRVWHEAQITRPHFGDIVSDLPYFDAAPHSRGRNDGSDAAHPTGTGGYAGEDGAPRFHYSLLDWAMAGAGLSDYTIPVFDSFEMSEDEDYFEVWREGQAVDNLWNIREDSIPGSTREGIGIKVNGTSPGSITYVDGRMRVTPVGATFSGFDLFEWDDRPAFMSARGVSAGDIANGFWKAFPHVVPNSAHTGLDAVGVDLNRTFELYPDLLENPITPPAPIFVNQNNGDNVGLIRSNVTATPTTKLILASRFSTAATHVGARWCELGGSDTCNFFVDGTASQLRVILRNASSTIIYEARYPLNTAVRNHIVTVDAPARVVKVYELTGAEDVEDVVPLTPDSVTTAWTDDVFTIGTGSVRLFTNSSNNASLRASVLGSVIISTATASNETPDFIGLGGVDEQANIHRLSQRMADGGVTAYAGRAQVVSGDDITAANYNAGTFNKGTGPKTGWSVTGTFLAI